MKTVIIIGAGPAGLTAAYELLKKGENIHPIILESESFEDAIRLAISIGGDSDTLGAITGAVAECFYGMTDAECDAICRYLDDDLNDLIDEFSANYRS